MKHFPSQPNTDPTAKKGNQKVHRHTTRVIVVAGTLVLAACSSQSGHTASPNKASVTTSAAAPERDATTTSPERNNEALKAHVQDTAKNFATRIMLEASKGESKHSFMYNKNSKGALATYINVLYDTKTLVAGAYGEYGLLASVHKDAKGNLDPSTVDMISVFENVNVAGTEVAKNPGDRVNLYGFMLSKDKTTGNWSVLVDQATEGSEALHLRYDTSAPNGQTGRFDSLSIGLFDALGTQANTVFDWAVEQTPVNYAPAAGK